MEMRPITGTQIAYYFSCHRQLWLHSHFLHFEQDSELVALGRLIHEESFQRERKEIRVGNEIVIDFSSLRNQTIHEIKKSDKNRDAHLMQLKYYLWFLKYFYGIEHLRGEIHYAKPRRKEEVLLTEEDEEKILQAREAIVQIVALPQPPPLKKIPFCRQCSYHDFCFVS
jgi:CRISPR-associated exonuclease Cas4